MLNPQIPKIEIIIKYWKKRLLEHELYKLALFTYKAYIKKKLVVKQQTSRRKRLILSITTKTKE